MAIKEYFQGSRNPKSGVYLGVNKHFEDEGNAENTFYTYFTPAKPPTTYPSDA